MTATEPANKWVTATAPLPLGFTPGSGGASFSNVTGNEIAADPVDPLTAWVVEWQGYGSESLFETTNGGRSWTVAENGIPAGNGDIQYMTYDVNTPGTLYAGSDGAMYISTNGGSSWSSVEGTGDIRSLWTWPGRPGTVVATSDQGAYISTDSANSWTSINGNITSSLMTDVAVSGNEILAPAQDYGPIESTDGGATWNEPPTPNYEDGSAAINPGNSSYQYLFAYGFSYSSDGGASFTWVPALATEWSNIVWNNSIAFDPNSPNVVYVAGTSGVWVSTDWGVDFSLESSWPANSANSATLIAVSPSNSSNLFLGTFDEASYSKGEFYTSNDGGSTWKAASGLAGSELTSIAVDPTNPSVVLVGTRSSRIYRSTNGGASFSLASSGVTVYGGPTWDPAVTSISFEPNASPPVVVAVGPTIGIVVSNDLGVTWGSALGNAVSHMFTGLSWSRGYLYASTFGEGILRTELPLAVTTTTTIPKENPKGSAPGAPSILVTSTVKGDIMIYITKTVESGSHPITKYEYSLNGGAWVNIVKNSNESFVIRHLTSGKRYSVRLRAVSAVGPGAPSSNIKVKVR